MSVTFTWDNADRTQLRLIFDTMWQIEDLQRVIHISQDLIADRGEVVDVIFDMSECESIPSNLARLRDHLREIDRDRVGVMVFVTRNIYLQRVMQLLNQLMRQYFTMHFTNTLHDAHRIAQRATITRQSHLIS